MSVYDRCVFLNAPVFLRETGGAQILQALARCVSNMEGGDILDIHEINLELLDVNQRDHPRGDADYLRQLETLHKSITLYLWMSYRYSGVFISQNVAFHAKKLVEDKIDHFLGEVNISQAARKVKIDKMRKEAKARKLRKSKILGDEAGPEDAEERPPHEGPGSWNEEGHEEPLYQDAKELKEITRVRGGHQHPDPQKSGPKNEVITGA